MVEVIHEHDTHRDSGSGLGLLLGVLFAVAVVLFLLYYFGAGLNVRNTTPQINIPERVNVDVNQR